MSLLFNALQRSEAERSGIDSSALSTATELLQIAEHQLVAERETLVQTEPPDLTRAAERETSFPLEAVEPVRTAVQGPVAAELSLNDKSLDQFRQFQSLQVQVAPQNRLVCLTDNESLAAEKFRFLGVRLRHLRRNGHLKKVLITSAIPQEGKSMVAANLACTLARRTQDRTLLVDGDLRRPSLSQMFGLGWMPGICEWLQGEQGPMTSIYNLEVPGFWFLPAGTTTGNPLELMQSGRLSALMDQLTAWFDWIIIDSPPVLPLADTSVWTRLAEGILLVTRQGTTEKRQLQRALEALESKKVIGALMNCSRNTAHSDYYYPNHSHTASKPNGAARK